MLDPKTNKFDNLPLTVVLLRGAGGVIGRWAIKKGLSIEKVNILIRKSL